MKQESTMEETELDTSEEHVIFTPDLSGLEKSAILLGLLGNDSVRPILPFLERDEVEQIAKSMADVESIKKDDVVFILDDFHKEMVRLVAPGIDDSQAQSFIEQYDEVQIELSPEAERRQQLKNIFALEDLEPVKLFRILEHEHPQIWAVILSQLSSTKAMEVLNIVESDKKYDILQRLAKLTAVNDDILMSLNQVLESKLEGMEETADYNGAKTTADILSLFPESDSLAIMEMFESSDKELHADVKSYFLTFSDLMGLDKSVLQKILAAFDPQVIATAICQSPQETIDNCFVSVTKRTKSLIEEGMKSLQQAPEAAVRTAQQKIIATARDLESQNVITLSTAE